jgi:hypothetical protein
MRQNFVNNELTVTSLLIPQLASGTTDVKSTGVDTRGFKSTVLVAHVGNSADTLSGSVKVEVEVQDSDVDSDGNYAAAADADVENANTGGAGTVTGTNVGTAAVIDAPTEDSLAIYARYKGAKRYARLVVNLTGTHTNGISVAAMALQIPDKLNA